MVKAPIRLAPELPQMAPDVSGPMVRRQDNSVFLGTGRIQFEVSRGAPAGQQVQIHYDGPVSEVVITRATKVYRDATQVNPSAQDVERGGMGEPVQEVLRPGSLDDLTTTSMVYVWGEKHGDRLVATALVYSAY
jgi:hypothetical protein